MKGNYKETVRTIIRQNDGGTSAAHEIGSYIESLMNTVGLNREMFIAKIEAVLSNQDAGDKNLLQNIVKSFFGIFGLNVIPKDLGDRIGSDQRELLAIDEVQAKAIMAAITSAVERMKQEGDGHAKRAEQLEGMLAAANRTVDELRKERDDLLKEQDRREKETLRAIQRMLAQRPDLKSDGQNETDALMMYLEDQGLTWSWDAEKCADDFTTYVISDEALAGVRMPCLYRGEATALKGLRYTVGK